MSRNVDYGIAICVLPLNGKIKDDWQQRDPEAQLDGSNSRLVVRDVDHAQALAASCAKIWSDYEQENALRGPKRGRKPGGGFRSLLAELNKLIEDNPEPTAYTSTVVAVEMEKRAEENKEVRQEVQQERARKRRRPKGTLEVFKPEKYQQFEDVNLRVPICVDYGEWTTGECAFSVRFGSELVLWGDGDTRDEAWADLCRNIHNKQEELTSRQQEEGEDFSVVEGDGDSCWVWLHRMIPDQPVPEAFKEAVEVEN